MALRINTNIAAMSAHKSLIKTDNALSESLGRLSTGLRINKAADDSSGMAIADSLRSQALGLGQAIRNGNDGISIVQTADAALEESINIVNTIKQKSIQAAQDGQTTESRKAIQADITKLRDELDTIAKTTAFNNQKLLSGSFTDKKFQIGAYSGETIDISIGSSEATKIGHVSVSELSFASSGLAELSIFSNLENATYNLNSVSVNYDNDPENSVGAVADAINLLSDKLGITADASVTTSTTSNIAAGSTDDTFAINGVVIGAVAVSENDSTGALVAVINGKSDQHGVVASIDQGFLTLTSSDDRAIEITQDTNTTAVLGGTTGMSTLGTVSLTQQGTADIVINNRLGGTAVALLDNNLELTGTTTTTASSSLASGSSIVAGSTIGAGSVLAIGAAVEVMSGTLFTTSGSIIGNGSTLLDGTIFNSGTTLQGTVETSGVTAGVGTLGSGSVIATDSTFGEGTILYSTATEGMNASIASTNSVSTIAAGSTIDSGSVFADGSYLLTVDFSGHGFDGASTTSGLYTIITSGAGSSFSSDLTIDNGPLVLAAGSTLDGVATLLASGTSIGNDWVASSAVTTSADMILLSGTSLATATDLEVGTNLTGTVINTGADVDIDTDDMTLSAGSTIMTLSDFANGSTISDAWYNNNAIAVTGASMTLGAGSSLVTASVLAEGSSIGGTVTLANNEQVDASTDMRLEAGSVLATGSTITDGTYLTNDVVANDGVTYTAGTVLDADIVTSGSTTMTNAMALNGGSIIMAGSTLAANTYAADNAALGSTGTASAYRLSDISVTSQEGAQIAISVADAALKNLDKVRSDLGSVQNQLTSTIANISTTRVNVSSAESTIRDVDFAEESATFTKMQILSQAGTFAMSQANSSAQQVLSLLQ